MVRGGVVAGTFQGRLLRPAYFMPLRAEDETGPSESGLLPGPGGLERHPAPWGDALETGRARFQQFHLLQALAFFAWLRGLRIGHQTSGEQPIFGIGDLVEGKLCWFGVRTFMRDGASVTQSGEWRDGSLVGVGVETVGAAERYEGEFAAGRRQGIGVLTLPNGNRFHGRFVDGERDGYGVEIAPNGTVTAGQWRRGVLERKED